MKEITYEESIDLAFEILSWDETKEITDEQWEKVQILANYMYLKETKLNDLCDDDLFEE